MAITSRFSSVTAMRQSLGWKTMESRRQLNAATMMFQGTNQEIHLFFPTPIKFADSQTRSNHPFKLKQTATHINVYKYSFFPHVISIYGTAFLWPRRRIQLRIFNDTLSQWLDLSATAISILISCMILIFAYKLFFFDRLLTKGFYVIPCTGPASPLLSIHVVYGAKDY